MNSSTDIKITGIDEEHPPRIRKESYIDLYFKLSITPPLDWCDDFNSLAHKIEPVAKIDKIKGNVIQTWVREMDSIPGHLEKIKKTVTLCNQQHMEKELKKQQAAALKNASVVGADGQQNMLNEIIAKLNFDIDDTAIS